MTFSLSDWLSLTRNLGFTGFLLLCVGILGYALYQLYLTSRTDWNQVQTNTQNIAQLNQNVQVLVIKIDQLIEELHMTNQPTQPPKPPSASS